MALNNHSIKYFIFTFIFLIISISNTYSSVDDIIQKPDNKFFVTSLKNQYDIHLNQYKVTNNKFNKKTSNHSRIFQNSGSSLLKSNFMKSFHVERFQPSLFFLLIQSYDFIFSDGTVTIDIKWFYFILFFTVAVIFYIYIQKERHVKKSKNKLRSMNERRTRELEMQKEELRTQIEFTTIQNNKIERQNKELEQHRKNLEALVKQRTNDLEIAKQRAEESDKLKSAFLANMSHEIRTPMNAIVGFSNILFEEDLPKEERDELLNHINESSTHLLKLIENIIDISKIETKELKFNFKLVNLNSLIDEVYYECENYKELKDRNISFHCFKHYTNKNIYFNTDPWRLKQILINLIDNSIKFTPTGQIEFGYRVIQTEPPKLINFYVYDTGIGMNEEQQQYIFKTFRKVSNSNVPFNRGMGIGLSICERLVHGMKGDILVESEFGSGSTFYFTLPEKSSQEDDPMIKAMSELPDNYDWSDKTLLLVGNDDSKELFANLSKTQINILQANDWKEIDQMSLDYKNNLHMILVSSEHAICYCLDVVQEIRKMNKNLPIIGLCSNKRIEDKTNILNAGFTTVIHKPCQPSKLILTIGHYISS